MINIVMDGFEKSLEITKHLNIITIENAHYYRNVIFNFESNVLITDNQNKINFEKEGLIIYNPYQLSVSDKKITTVLYKKLLSHINDSSRNHVASIENSAIKLIDEVVDGLDFSIEYSESIDIPKLFNAFNVAIKEPDFNNYLEVLITYIKINLEFTNAKYYVFYGLTNILSQEEYCILEHELSLIGVYVIDLVFRSDNKEKIAIVDSDYCIL